MAVKKESITPFLKWAGGKRWLVENHLSLFPKQYARYIEPFVGSASVYFSLKPSRAILGDDNKELIETYMTVRDHWEQVEAELRFHDLHHSSEHYYQIRDSKPRLAWKRAARFIYLNRTCWNGLYRVNQKGQFNVPIGTKTKVLMESDNFKAVAAQLKKSRLIAGDFEDVIDKAGDGDFIFADPPYTALHNNNGFIKYNEQLFGWFDQIRLKDALVRAKARGASVLMTNANHVSIVDLYRTGFKIDTVTRQSVIAGDADARKKTSELVIRG